RLHVHPTPHPFNSIIRLQIHKPPNPFNPIINPPPLTLSSLLSAHTAKQKLTYFFHLITILTPKTPLINQTLFQSQSQTSHPNPPLPYYLKQTNYLQPQL
ncbi:glutaminase, partial [Priestia megaterium]|uniref:glutaminase n=1 Tax=Priestia megaterium TaxID=1404 RepID=UPI001649F326